MRQQKREDDVRKTLVEILKEPMMDDLVSGRLAAVAGN